MQQLFGQLSLSDGQLLLDGDPIADGQLVAFQYGGSRWLHARVTFHQKGYWYLDLSPFAGHTYFNIRLSAKAFDDLRVQVVHERRQER